MDESWWSGSRLHDNFDLVAAATAECHATCKQANICASISSEVTIQRMEKLF